MTPQEIFDTSLIGLINQGEQSRANAPYGGCKYRTADGRKCAVGFVIPDASYKYEMDNSDDTDIETVAATYDLPEYIRENVQLLRDLQHLHDSWDYMMKMPFIEYLKADADRIAHKHGLSAAAVLAA